MAELLNIPVSGDRADAVSGGFDLARRLTRFGMRAALSVPGSNTRLLNWLLGARETEDPGESPGREPVSVCLDGVDLLSHDTGGQSSPAHDLIIHTLDMSHPDWPQRQPFDGELWLLVEPRAEAISPAWLVLNELVEARYQKPVRVVMTRCRSAEEGREAFHLLSDALDEHYAEHLVLVGSVLDTTVNLPSGAVTLDEDPDTEPGPLMVLLQPKGQVDISALLLAALGNFVPECAPMAQVDVVEQLDRVLEPFESEPFEIGYWRDVMPVQLVSRPETPPVVCGWHTLEEAGQALS